MVPFPQEKFVELNTIVANNHTTVYSDAIPNDNKTSELKELPSDNIQL